MNMSTNRNLNGELITIDQACAICNLGKILSAIWLKNQEQCERLVDHSESEKMCFLITLKRNTKRNNW